MLHFIVIICSDIAHVKGIDDAFTEFAATGQADGLAGAYKGMMPPARAPMPLNAAESSRGLFGAGFPLVSLFAGKMGRFCASPESPLNPGSMRGNIQKPRGVRFAPRCV